MQSEAATPQLGLRGRHGRRLTHDLLEAVLRRLSAKDLAAAELTCRHWQAVIRERTLWKPHCENARHGQVINQDGSNSSRCSSPSHMRSPRDLGAPLDADCDFRREFLQAASARRWVGAGEHVHLKSQEISTAPPQHMAACSGMLACAMGREVRLYDVDQGAWRHRLSAGTAIGGVAMATPHLTLAAAGSRVLLWRGDKLIRSFTGAHMCLRYVGTANGVIASATLRDSAVQLHDLYGGGLTSILRPHGSDARLTALHLSGTADGGVTLASGAADNSICLTDAADGSTICAFSGELGSQTGPIMVHHIPAQQRLLATWGNGRITAYDLRSAGGPLFSVLMHCSNTPLLASVPAAAGGAVCAVIDAMTCFGVVDTATGRVLAARPPAPADRSPPPAASPPGKAAAASEARPVDTLFKLMMRKFKPAYFGGQALCATAVAGQLAVSMPRGVQLWRLPGYETLEFDRMPQGDSDSGGCLRTDSDKMVLTRAAYGLL